MDGCASICANAAARSEDKVALNSCSPPGRRASDPSPVAARLGPGSALDAAAPAASAAASAGSAGANAVLDGGGEAVSVVCRPRFVVLLPVTAVNMAAGILRTTGSSNTWRGHKVE